MVTERQYWLKTTKQNVNNGPHSQEQTACAISNPIINETRITESIPITEKTEISF